jgi:hypothetical protein
MLITISADHRFSWTTELRTLEGMEITDREIEQMSWRIEATRSLRDETAGITAVVHRAAAEGASPVLIGVLADPTAPEVARIRAFGKLALQLARPRPVLVTAA